jgi:hypothetical protein
MQFQNEHGRFDAWMRMLENTIDGRGRHGSLVYASDEFKKGGIGVDGSLMEYAVMRFYISEHIYCIVIITKSHVVLSSLQI